MIAHDLRTIFVHIQKTGGSSICAALGADHGATDKHRLACELRPLYGEDAWRDYFKFAFVRNPFDRMVSWWSMIDQHRPAFVAGQRFNNFYSFVLSRAHSFADFLNLCDEEIEDADGRKWIYRNQADYISDATGKVMVDFVGRFENLPHDFDVVARKIGVTAATLPHVNQSAHAPYWSYYTSSLVDKVGSRFARDIEMFGYVFGR